ncbi:hypothetical protein GC089_02235 [Cellulomonas sp. JZ18]|uniref:hypothetical protein n=1 Tax=Cellulomonas sp. JZ18 TaxID=2654191 RepID=UPI0012D48535|nr:hypothetical protein [Cellulomonas sp. JZ18]QGQ18296.1 hypothetical protein GC089_02235 [Cellulomonas sp. JZ18]
MVILAWTAVLVPLLLVASWAWQTCRSAERPGGPADRAALVTGVAEAVALVALARALTRWEVVPDVLWFALVALVAAGVAGTVRRWPGLPGLDPARPGRRRAALVTELAVAAALVAVTL